MHADLKYERDEDGIGSGILRLSRNLSLCLDAEYLLSDGVKCARGCAFKGRVWTAVGGYSYKSVRAPLEGFSDRLPEASSCMQEASESPGDHILVSMWET